MRGLLNSLAQAEPGPFAFWTLLIGVVALGLVKLGFTLLRRARMLEDIPTSRIRSAAQGYVELHGHARMLPGPEIRSPLSLQRCCWWEYKVERRRGTDEGGQRNREWTVVEQNRSDDLFLLVDGTGECVVDPVGARVIPSLSRRWQGNNPRPLHFPKTSSWFSFGDYRYTERIVQYGDWLYALGQFQSQTAARADDESQDVSHLLADWKRDQRQLLRRFDANGDGRIDMDEWEVARRMAVEQVRNEQTERSVEPARVTVSERSEVGADAGRPGASRTHLLAQDTVSAPDLHVLNQSSDSRPFILSTKTEHELTRGMRWGGLAAAIVGLGMIATVCFVLVARGLL